MEEQCYFVSWHVVGSVFGDCYITRQHARSDLRYLRMQASVEVAGTRIATTRYTPVLIKGFVRGYGRRTSRWICSRIASLVTEKSLKKVVRKQAVEEQCQFFFSSWHVVGSVSGDCYITRQHARADIRCLRFLVI